MCFHNVLYIGVCLIEVCACDGDAALQELKSDACDVFMKDIYIYIYIPSEEFEDICATLVDTAQAWFSL